MSRRYDRLASMRDRGGSGCSRCGQSTLASGETMNLKAILLGTATFAVLAVPAMAQTATSTTTDAPKKHRHHHEMAAASTGSDRIDLLEKRLEEQAQEIQDLKTQVQANQSGGQQVTAAQFEALQNQVYESQAAVKAATTPHDKKIHFKGVTFQFGGFLAMESVWRSNSLESDIGSPGYSSIPFAGPGGTPGNNVDIAHTREFRFSARQSRVSGLAQADIDPTTHVTGYGEFDFLGAAASANSKESNSYQPRVRNLYGTVDWDDIGFKFLFGQSWSLATLDANGISERSELAPPTIEAQYVAGFVWTRQPQLRVVKQFGDDLWLGLSLENPQTTIGGNAPSGYSITTTNGSSFSTSGANSTADAEFNPGITLSLNQAPDVIGKVAWEPSFFDGNVHLEGVGMLRQFYDRVGMTGVTSTFVNHSTSGGGGGVAGLIKLVPGLFDLQFDTLFGSGIGRYGSGQLSDTTYNANGTLHPLNENMEMVGGTLHATHDFDIYVFAGRESEDRSTFGTTTGGYGNPNDLIGGCDSYNAQVSPTPNPMGIAYNDSCKDNVKTVSQINIGFWDKLYNGDYGSVRFGVQYSYTHLTAFQGIEGTTTTPAGFLYGSPHTDDNMIFTSFRYYPF